MKYREITIIGDSGKEVYNHFDLYRGFVLRETSKILEPLLERLSHLKLLKNIKERIVKAVYEFDLFSRCDRIRTCELVLPNHLLPKLR